MEHPLLYFRTGSSLLGDIIAASENTTYMFEPLHMMRKHVTTSTQIAHVTDTVLNFITNLLKCKDIAVFKKDKFITGKSKQLENCHGSLNVVIKSIRLSAQHVEKLLKILKWQNFKIIHLVRDPRAILSSMLRQPKAWKPYLRSSNGTVVCEIMSRNYQLFDEMMEQGILNPGNFAEINYDNWMDNIWETIIQLYTFLDVQLTTNTVKQIQVGFQTFQFNVQHLLNVKIKQMFF